jgi:hypothetical protein
VDLLPRVKLRKKGILQRGTREISGSTWQYDGGPLYLAVICQRKWAPIKITHQRFAVVASVSHDKAHSHVSDLASLGGV